MSEIKKGDLVTVVRSNGCRCQPKTLGRIFIVEHLFNANGRCTGCGAAGFGPGIAASDTKTNMGWRLPRLLRIGPPAESTDTPTREELPEVVR